MPRPRGGAARPVHRPQLRRPRRRARRARPLRRGVPDLRPDGLAAARSFFVLAHLVRARAARPHGRGKQAMGLALDAAGGQPEPTAWVDDAARQARLVARPGATKRNSTTAPRSRSSPATSTRWSRSRSSEEAKGRHRAARSRSPAVPPRRCRFRSPSRRSATSTPAPDRNAPPQRQYALVDVIERLLVANGVRTDLETAHFDVDHGVRLGRALALARQARRARPSIDGDDVLAWALARNGRCAEALPYSRRALRLGTHDALKFFHRGMIERCLGARVALVARSTGAAPESALLAPLEPASRRRYAS